MECENVQQNLESIFDENKTLYHIIIYMTSPLSGCYVYKLVHILQKRIISTFTTDITK